MEVENILLKDKVTDGILRLTLNNSKHQNTLSELMMESLTKELSEARFGTSCALPLALHACRAGRAAATTMAR